MASEMKSKELWNEVGDELENFTSDISHFVQVHVEIFHKELCKLPAPKGCTCAEQMKSACLYCWQELLDGLEKSIPSFLSFNSIKCKLLGDDFWQFAKVYMGPSVPKDKCNSADDTDVSGLCNVILYCPRFFGKDDLNMSWDVWYSVRDVLNCRHDWAHCAKHVMSKYDKEQLCMAISKIKDWIQRVGSDFNLTAGEEIILLLS